MTSPFRVLRQIVAPTGRHRPAAVASCVRVPLEDLLGSWEQAVPAPVHGAVVTQAWNDCVPCGKATAGVVHKDGWTCSECLTVTVPGGAS
ncbi:hypothetical protein ACH4UM_18655 [Streptomyces sp. NPDC020801]|uniref:hypothetical protein n=1 Tax=Streptomyces sp. NPDC020801 TaxID=3365093 RepID=UPI0037AF5A0C